MRKIDLKYLVVGTGRSGTVYMARLLTSLGVMCGHECVFDHSGWRWAEKRLRGELSPQLSQVSSSEYNGGKWTPQGDWLPADAVLVAESSYMATPYLREDLLSGVKVIHAVRDPVKVVNSFCNYLNYFGSGEPMNSYEHFIYKWVPDLCGVMGQYDRASLYYVLWNEMIEIGVVACRHRVEDDPDKIAELVSATGKAFSDKTVNSFKKDGTRQFSPSMIESREIRDRFISMGRRYGYDMLSEYMLI